MRSTGDPLLRWRRRERGLLAVGLLAILSSLAWALWPLPNPPVIDAVLETPEGARSGGEQEGAHFDRQAFAAPIWNPPPQPLGRAGPPAPEKPAPALRLQLIGIAQEHGPGGETILRAAVFDPQTDKLYFVASGETVGGVAIAEVDRLGVSVDTNGRSVRLTLRDEVERQ